MNEIVLNVYQLELPLPNDPLGHVNAYLIRGEDGCLLVDTGYRNEESFGSLRKQIAEFGIATEDISQVVSTHIHPDHYDAAGRLRELSDATIALHYLERDLISIYSNFGEFIKEELEWMRLNGMPTDKFLQLLSEVRSTRPEWIEFPAPVLPDSTLNGGETISVGSFDFEVLWTPGHSPGHICLYEPTREILVSGDHILPDITTDVCLEPISRPNPLADYLNSLKQIRRLKVNLVLPGHRQPFIGLRQRIDDIMRNIRQRSCEILSTLQNQAKTGYQISNELAWVRNGKQVRYQDMNALDRWISMLNTLAHLESMRAKRKVEKVVNKNNTISYKYKLRDEN